MKKILFFSGALFALFLLTQNVPATVIVNDDQVITWNGDDTTKVAKTNTEADKDSGTKKVYCDPAKCETLCGKKAAKPVSKSCCPSGKAPKTDPEKK